MPRPTTPRPRVSGPDSGPEHPFPIKLSGPVVKGFGRGSKELGIPTANIPPDGLEAYPDLPTGVYYGVVALDPSFSSSFSREEKESTGIEKVEKVNEDDASIGDGGGGGVSVPEILPAVLSIGFNPFYKNTVRSIEIHIMAPLPLPPPSSSSSSLTPPTSPSSITFNKLPDFYSTKLNLLILGYIRPEYDYVSLQALIDDIRVDCDVARRSLSRESYACYLGLNYREGEHSGSASASASESDSESESVRRDREWLVCF